MELINRYIYAVTERLPEAQRADIAKELRGLIEDMLEERVGGGDPAKGDIEEVLLELGDPVSFADKYRGTKRYLIGPDLFTPYYTILKIVLFAIAVAMSVVLVIEVIFEPTTVPTHIFSLLPRSLMLVRWLLPGSQPDLPLQNIRELFQKIYRMNLMTGSLLSFRQFLNSKSK
ncbi:HAAS signaling domain-containing protein [Anaerobacillus sp. CMMVII]|uniref:HAAS signaling domain-containing protein n=1 Tax=Anaerobacillus sp. CMMVII TaxID=2755588 RepID=UPI0037C012C0